MTAAREQDRDPNDPAPLPGGPTERAFHLQRVVASLPRRISAANAARLLLDQVDTGRGPDCQ